MLKSKNILKSTYYTFVKPEFVKDIEIHLGFCFHTEHIFDQTVFDALLFFCKEFNTITGAQPICTVMTPANPRVKEGLSLHRCSESTYIKRVEELSAHAHIGFHGHFWKDPAFFKDEQYDIKKDNLDYKKEILVQQFEEQVGWFAQTGLPHHNTYAAGWWFINKDLLSLLAKHQFRFDYSFSKSPHYYNRFSSELMESNHIKFGESFETLQGDSSLLHTQNLIGHISAFPEDFIRNTNKLIDGNKKIYGVMNAHDYDVPLFSDILKCIRYLKKNAQVSFHSHPDFIRKVSDADLKRITL